ncbi:hypothetical protein [Actinoplanes palleronii]|uniref:Uncharacterized protein n=1 Tax=Actinoplanes palleronii TaxID=113570 RepID=A0ABQ4BE47_9ACTN|nr:hypothetical protein [Actinoplanes palleronii]GIE68962.1 hypothetical protein Apa02nite_050700 [Actinoplanes palleronii]
MSAGTHTVDTRDGIAQGVIVMTVFSLAWVVLAATAAPSTAATIGLAVLGVAVTAAVAVTGLRLAARSAARGTTRRVSASSRTVFGLVNLGQTVLILVAVFGLTKAGHPGLIPAAVCFVVGLHFLPLARVFDVRTYWLTGALLVAVAAVGAIFFAYDADAALVRAVVGLPAAVTLWLTSLLVARRG